MKKNITLGSYISMAVAALGCVLELIGAFAFGAATSVGFNLNWASSPVAIIGIVLVALSLVSSLALIIVCGVKKEEKVMTLLSVEIAVTALLFSIIFLILFSAWPVITTL